MTDNERFQAARKRRAESRVRAADGMTGILIRGLNGAYYFRVTHDTGFTDYKLIHSDMQITINDADAVLWENEQEDWRVLDHSPATLGIKLDGDSCSSTNQQES